MADKLGEAILELRTDDNKYYTGIDKAKHGAQGLESSFKKAGKGLLDTMSKLSIVGMAAFRMFQQIGRGVKDLTDAYAVQANAEAKRNQILKTTGNVVNKTTSELNKMASEIQRFTGIGDEAVINAQGIMLTFKQIGEEVFPRALEAAVDISAAFGQDLQASTIMLGKALEDPIRGMGALRRVGVTFSAEAENMIKRMWEMGDAAGAQAEMLKAIEGQVKGVARAMGETSVGQLKKFSAAMGDVKEELGKALTEMIAPVANKITDFFQKNKGNFYAAIKGFPEIAKVTFGTIGKIIETTFKWDTIKGLFGSWFEGMINQFKIVWKYFPQMAIEAINVVTTPLQAIGEFLASVFANVWARIRNTGVNALQDLVQPINEIIKALNFITGAEAGKNIINFDFLKQEIPKIKDFGDIWDKNIKEAGKSMENLAKLAIGYIKDTTSNYKSMFKEIGELYSEDIEDYKEKLNEILNKYKEINDELEETGNKLEEAADTVTSLPTVAGGHAGVGGYGNIGGGESAQSMQFKQFIGNLQKQLSGLGMSFDSLNKILSPLNTIFTSMFNVLNPVIDGLLQPIIGALSIMGQTLGQLIIPILQFFAPVIEALAKGFMWLYNNAIQPLTNAIIWVFNKIYNFVADIWNAIASAINFLLGWAGVHLDKMKKKGAEEGYLEKISMEDILNAGAVALDAEVTGAGATYEQARPIMVTIDVHDNQVFGGSLREFAIIMRNELEALEVLNL